MKKNKLTFLLYSVLFTHITFGQSNANLSKAQMYEDYDSLINKVERVSAHLEPKKVLWNYDILQQVKDLRHEIDTITTYDSFWFLVNRALSTCQDGHTRILTKNDYFFTIWENFNVKLPFQYINGEYLSIKPFAFQGQSFPIGTTAVKFNDQEIHEFMQTVTQYAPAMRYDLNYNRFYDNRFYQNYNILLKGQFSVSFKKPGGSLTKLNFKITDSVTIQKSKSIDSIYKIVEFWDEQNVLYIRVPAMDEGDISFYRKEIRRQSKGKQIEKIVIDVRDNGGGSNLVWIAIYEALIASPIKYELTLCGNKPDFMPNQYLKSKRINTQKLRTEKYSFLNNKLFFKYQEGNTVLKPSKKSIKFNGKIFVIGNEYIYSSTGSCMRLANANPTDNIISIGRPTGRFLGDGYDPLIFKLPNSKIEFIVAPAIDMSDAQTAKDIMHDAYEIIIPYSLQEFEDILNFSGNIWDKEYLIKYDPFIKTVLEK
jgi:hypothetical protein